MKINWFSPLLPARTGIANYAVHVLEALAKDNDVSIWTDQAEVDSSISDFGKLVRYDRGSPNWLELHQADVTIYNIGNNPDFHGGILEVSRRSPGVVILHDLRLHDLTYMRLVHERQDKQSYIAVLGRWYGEEGRRAGTAFCSGGVTPDYMSEHFPLTRDAINLALGVVTHCEGLEEMGEAPFCPHTVLHHPYKALSDAEYTSIEAARRRRTAPPFRLVVFGFLSRNRRIESVLRALAGTQGRSQFRLEICGQLWDESHIRALIGELGLVDLVTLRGYMPQDKLHKALAGADLALNLRYPSMGEASGSQCRLWDYGLPTLVTKTQWYAKLPEETVAFVRQENELADIQEHLEAFLANPVAYYEQGAEGRRRLREYDPGEYGRRLTEFSQLCLTYRSRMAGLDLAERIGEDASMWLHADSAGPLFDRVTREVEAAFGAKNNEE